jgi:hypothetical protein
MPLPKFGEDFEFPDEAEEKSKKQEAAEDDKFEVEIEDDTPPEDRGRKPMKEAVEDPTDDELSSYDEKVQSRIKKFTRGYHDERRAKEEAVREREAAETFARHVYEENKRLQQRLANGSKALIETSRDAADSKLQTAKRKLKEAHEIGDFDAVADAQAEIADATMEIRSVASMRPVEVDSDRFVTPPQAQQQQQPTISRRTQRWVEENNDWWGVDDEMTATALGLDKKLAKEYGTEYVGTEEYYRTIDKTMRKRFPEHFESDQSHEDDEPPRRKRAEPADEEDSPRRASRPATVVASATRSTPPNRVKLKGSEATIARRLGVPIEEYAKQVALLRKGN